MGRKVAALKDAEERCEMELKKRLKFFAAKDYETRIAPKQNRSPRKQIKPRNSLAGLLDTVDILDSSSDEDNKNKQQKRTKEECTEKKTSRIGHILQHFLSKPTTKTTPRLVRTKCYGLENPGARGRDSDQRVTNRRTNLKRVRSRP